MLGLLRRIPRALVANQSRGILRGRAPITSDIYKRCGGAYILALPHGRRSPGGYTTAAESKHISTIANYKILRRGLIGARMNETVHADTTNIYKGAL